MKNTLLLFIVLIGFHATAVAQKRKQTAPPPPPMVRELDLGSTPRQTIYERLLNPEKNHAFAITVNADTTLYPKEVFKKQLEIGDNGVRLETASAKDTLRIKKGGGISTLSHYVKYTFYEMKIAEDIATLTGKERAQVLKFKIFLNRDKTKVVKLQNLATKEFYLPAAYIGAVPSIGF